MDSQHKLQISFEEVWKQVQKLPEIVCPLHDEFTSLNENESRPHPNDKLVEEVLLKNIFSFLSLFFFFF